MNRMLLAFAALAALQTTAAPAGAQEADTVVAPPDAPAAAGAPADAAAPPRPGARLTLLIAAGQPTGVGFAVAGAVARVVDEQAPVTGFRVAVQATTGSMESLVRLSNGEFDLALVGADWLAAARAGTGAFQGQPPRDDLRLVAALYPETLTVLVRANDGIADLADLAGRTVNVGPADASSRPLFERVLVAAGVPLGAPTTLAEVPLGLQGQALCLGEVDAIAYLAAHPSGSIRAVSMSCPIAVVPVDGEAATNLVAGDPALLATTVPPGFYLGPSEATPSIGPAVVLVTTTALPEATGYDIAGALFEQLNTLCVQVPVLADCDSAMMTEAAAGVAPRQDGVARWLSETAAPQ
jgi:TRAP transporter TAXI family solute receptor